MRRGQPRPGRSECGDAAARPLHWGMPRPKAPPIDLTEFETHVRVRPTRIEDYPRIGAWGG
jgi:hypothetical protein